MVPMERKIQMKKSEISKLNFVTESTVFVRQEPRQ